jgi:hypothetical protein
MENNVGNSEVETVKTYEKCLKCKLCSICLTELLEKNKKNILKYNDDYERTMAVNLAAIGSRLNRDNYSLALYNVRSQLPDIYKLLNFDYNCAKKKCDKLHVHTHNNSCNCISNLTYIEFDKSL